MSEGTKGCSFTDEELDSLKEYIPCNPCICCDNGYLCESNQSYPCNKKHEYYSYMEKKYPRGTLRYIAELIVVARIIKCTNKKNNMPNVYSSYSDILSSLRTMINGMCYGAYDYTDLHLSEYEGCTLKNNKRY